MFEQRTLMKGAITMNMKDYISNYCTACGGNWTSMLMSGIKVLFPEYWEAMPDKSYELYEIVEHLEVLGITKE